MSTLNTHSDRQIIFYCQTTKFVVIVLKVALKDRGKKNEIIK